ncbi:MAG: hypothetical protein K0U98_27045 [Deltaproteobacteria bacterium]|nr:hypothetical protein [Deltaproteobacteria bacterium]
MRQFGRWEHGTELTIKRSIIIAISICVVLLLAYYLAFLLVDPTMSVDLERSQNGDVWVQLRPNFVVNSARDTVIEQGDLVLLKIPIFSDSHEFVLNQTELKTGDKLNVRSSLQHDRLVPSTTSFEQTVTLP